MNSTFHYMRFNLQISDICFRRQTDRLFHRLHDLGDDFSFDSCADYHGVSILSSSASHQLSLVLTNLSTCH